MDFDLGNAESFGSFADLLDAENAWGARAEAIGVFTLSVEVTITSEVNERPRPAGDPPAVPKQPRQPQHPQGREAEARFRQHPRDNAASHPSQHSGRYKEVT